jgi:hypothetical protein
VTERLRDGGRQGKCRVCGVGQESRTLACEWARLGWAGLGEVIGAVWPEKGRVGAGPVGMGWEEKPWAG